MTSLPPIPAQGRRLLRLGVLSAVVAALAATLLLSVSGWFLTAAALAGAAGPVAALAFNYLIPSAAIRLLAILRTVSRYGERLFSHQAALGAMADLRGTLFARLAAQDNRTAPDLSGGDSSARLIGDIESLEDLIVRRPAQIAGLGAAIAAVMLTLLAGWGSGAVLLILLAALPPILGALSRRLTRDAARDAADSLGALRVAYVDYAAARAEIAAYGLAGQVLADLAPLIDRLDRARARLHRGEGMIAALMAAFGAVTVALVYMTATGSAPRVALAMLASAGAVEAMTGLARTHFRKAGVDEGLRRLTDLLALRDGQDAASVSPSTPMALRLAGQDVMPGGRVAITGRSGTGKTLALDALAGLRAVRVDICLDDSPVTSCPPALLRDQCALSAQDAPMIAGSIADNLRLARPGIDADAMWSALHVACLDDRVRAMAAGLDTMLGEQGGHLSGGERKRLSLARALLAGRPWLLLDEPTEGLDSATEAMLVERLDHWLADMGTGLLLVSHRPAPLALVDQRVAVETLNPHIA